MTEKRSWMFPMSGRRPPLSLNDRGNHYARARLTRSVRDEASWRARSARIPRPLAKVRVEVIWVVGDHRRRDEDNPAPSAKAVYDGLVDAGIVPDDTPEFMEKPSVRIEYRQGVYEWFVKVTDLTPKEVA